MPKITPAEPNKETRIKAKTTTKVVGRGVQKWWLGENKADRGILVLETASYLKEQLQYRYRQASINSRLYGNMPMMGMAGTSLQRLSTSNQLPLDRPTMNVVQSCVDTLVSRITQSRPRPVFLTDQGDYKARKLAKQLNTLAQGELYQTKAYELGEYILRDAAVLGTGCIKVYESQDHKVAIERVLLTELLVDPNDSLYGDPRQMYQLKLVDRSVLAEMFPDQKSLALSAEQAYPDSSGDSSKTVSDQVMLVEGWHLPSGPNAKDGKHIIACTSGTLFEEDWEKDSFPFVFLHYSPRLLGFFAQPLAEQLMGTQIEINKLLITISKSINLVGVPRVFVEDGSKVVKAHLNNEIGSIVTYRGTKPEYEVAPCVPAEVYAQLQRLVEYAYQQSGISSLAAASQKPSGLDSGQALREYDDLQTDRFAALNKRYDNMFIHLTKQIIDLASEISEREGKYESVFPGKNGLQRVDLPKINKKIDPFVIKCMDSSSLPKDPAGRKQEVVDRIQAGLLSVDEGRRLLDLPDLEESELLLNAAEERILQVLDMIVEDGKYTPPDEFMNLQMAMVKCNQYYNLYSQAKLEERKIEMLRTFNTQCQALVQASMPPAPPAAPGGGIAQPAPSPVSPLVPQPHQP